MSAPATDKLILGTVQFGLDYGINNSAGRPDNNEVAKILDSAFANNIRILDSAEAYGDAHGVIGNYHKSSSNRFEIVTKFSEARKDLSPDITERVKENLATLRVEQLYAYMFHSFRDFVTHFGRFKKPLLEMKKKGLLGKIGVSIYTNHEFELVLQHGDIDLIQLPFNILDNNKQRAGLMERAKKTGIEVHTRSVFLQGLFFKELGTLPQKLEPLAPYLKVIRSVSNGANIDVGTLALNYALLQDNIDRVLIGVDTVKQLEQNIKSIGKIKEDVVSMIDSINVVETELLNPANWNS